MPGAFPVGRGSGGKDPDLVWRCGRFSLPVGRRCHVIGIINVNSVSYFRHNRDDAVRRGLEIVKDGVDIIEVGGESARPGSDPVSADEEQRSVLPVIEALAPLVDIPISVDTTKASVASAALDVGASVVNDISALLGDPSMLPLLAARDCGVVLMHMRGTPKAMQQLTAYVDVVSEVRSTLLERARTAEEAGIRRERIAIDPGLGFAKTHRQCLRLIRETPSLVATRYPVLIAPSRKAFIGRTLGLPPKERLEGTAAVVAWSVVAGASVVRVHDVGAMVRVVRMTEAILSAGD
jgi:dihydropteroate synthase